jgi:tetratricopeptide (TPR) repeat protein
MMMDEQKQQVYLQFIQELLTSETGQEAEILAGHQNLVDEGLVMMALTVARMLEERDGQKAELTVLRLMGFAQDLAEQLGLVWQNYQQDLGSNERGMSNDFEVQQQFLSDVLLSVDQNNGDSQVIYPLLRENLGLLNNDMVEVLRDWASSIFAEVEEDDKKSIAMVIGNFSVLIGNFPLGNKAVNMELSIAGYEILLEVFTVTESPEIWAQTQNNLASSYSRRIKGDRTENQEKAIAVYESALQIRNKDNFPIQWATTQDNLASAYSQRIKGDRAENLEKAIAGYQAVLEIYTKEDFPIDWAITQNNLASAYSARIKGGREKNQEKAIVGYQAVLEIYTKEWEFNNVHNYYFCGTAV